MDALAIAPFACDPARSRGRLHAEPESRSRSAFRRDCDRIIHSTAFRRLKHKTQVFVFDEGDHYRTRLTHTLEVAQVARAIARRLRLDEDLAEALALAHDLGHPPFGHAGERALNACLAAFGGFDHNAQTLRIVTALERRYPHFDGLNLTWETLEGLVKHNGPLTDRAGTPLPHYREHGVPATILEYSKLQDLQLWSFAGVEAQIAAFADDIAYDAHDIDDGLRADLFAIDDIAAVPLPGKIIAAIRAAYPGLDAHRTVHEFVRELIGFLIDDVVAETGRRLAALAPRSADDVRRAATAVAGFSPDIREADRAIKAFLERRMYRASRVMRVMDQAADVVRDLFARYSGHPGDLPADWQEGLADLDEATRARRIADFIAGMTDRFALAEHARLFDSTPELRQARGAFLLQSMVTKNIFADVLARVLGATDALVAAGTMPAGIDRARVTVEPPRDPTHGDIATNAAMVLAKDAGKKPRDLAEAIAERLRADGQVASVDVAGPGFINLTLKPSAWIAALRSAIELGADYGRSDVGAGVAVNVEYVSANPTGPMHVGHCRGAVFGDALANLLDFTGYKVTREYYVNDAGAQVDALARSTYLRYREALGENIGQIPEGLYPGDYLKPVGALIAKSFGESLKSAPEPERLSVVRAIALEQMMLSIREDLAALGVNQERFFHERTLIFQDEAGANSIDFVARTIAWLRERGLVYEGRLPPPKGAPIEDWEDREQTLFRSTAFGDDVDRPLMKSDGSYTYFASDIAYHRTKIERGFRTLIDVWGADHGGYIKRMQAAVKALSEGKAELDVKVIQLVKLLRAGQPVKMSKRAGEFVTLREVVEEVGPDAVRFMMLFRKNDAVLEFDLAKVLEQSRDNPVFYVQYGHARAQSIFRNARAAFPDLPQNIASLAETANLAALSDPAELALMRRIGLYPRTVEAAAAAHEPHRIAFYLFDLASEFHALYTLGNASPHLRFIIQNDRQLTEARLVLVGGVATVLASGLKLLGVAAPDEMR